MPPPANAEAFKKDRLLSVVFMVATIVLDYLDSWSQRAGQGSHPTSGCFDGGMDARVRAAATDIAVHPGINLLIAWRCILGQ